MVCLARQEMSNACAELEGQGSGTGDTGQDVGSPAKKMRTGSGFAHGRDGGNAICQTLFPVITWLYWLYQGKEQVAHVKLIKCAASMV